MHIGAPLLSRTQWNVGQGGFHTASYDLTTGRDVQYVYDCGSRETAALTEAITEYTRRRGTRLRIDALVLSHIDEDHVNGVPELLSVPDLTVEYVLLPLLTNVERLFALSRLSPTASESVIRLTADPIEIIQEIQPGARVVEIAAGGTGASTGDLPTIDPGANANLATLIGDSAMVSQRIQGRPTIVDDSVGVRIGGFRDGSWLLTFYVASHTKHKLRRFQESVAKTLKMSIADVASIDTEGIRTVASTAKGLQLLRDAYNDAQVNTNGSSLVMLSSPLNASSLTEDLHLGSSMVSYGQQPSWLHTGDARLRVRGSKALRRHFGGHQLDTVGTLTLPHHGSGADFHPQLLKEVPNLAFAIALRGPHADAHGWAHPSPQVISDVCATAVVPWVVSDAPASMVQGKIGN